jgi:hypothetical protein
MGEAFFRYRPFKPLVERSSRSTLIDLGRKGEKYPKNEVFLPPRPAKRQVFALNPPLRILFRN